MCLIIHKPRTAAVPRDLLIAAAERNGDGFGVMALTGGGRVRVVRRKTTRIWELLAVYDDVADLECAFHLRGRTRGDADEDNAHPIELAPDLYVMHNGEADIPIRLSTRSDTWHLVRDFLRPVLRQTPQALDSLLFAANLGEWIGPRNKLVLMDGRLQRTIIINRQEGLGVDGLWLSGTRWFDAARFNKTPRQPLPRHRTGRLEFL